MRTSSRARRFTSVSPIDHSSLPRRSRAFVSARLWLINVALCAFLCGEYLETAHPGSARAWTFLVAGLLSCAATLSLVPGLVLLGAAALIRGRWPLAILSGLVWSLVLLAVFVDTRIYEIFRYHFNGLVWNVLTTPGADEAVEIDGVELASTLACCAALVPVQCAVFLFLWGRAGREARPPTPFLLRPKFAWSAILVPSMLFTAGEYAYSDFVRDPQVMAFARVYPLYPRFTVKRFAAHTLGIEPRKRPKVGLSSNGILLDYPKSPVAVAPGKPRPNVLVVVVDSLRADMLTSETMPRTSELAARGRVFRDHLSTGNATRFGLFGLFYGLHGSYWHPIENEHRSPVLVDVLLELGYEPLGLTSASWDFPEFRSTLWASAPEAAHDRLPSEREGGRDDGVAARFEQWLDGRTATRPFFALLLLDAPHGQYHFPAEFAAHRPYAEDVEYLELAEATPDDVRLVRNRYENAVLYDDSIIGRVLDALAEHEALEDTLIVVTGDHGEEFLENGYWGHTSNFTLEQVHVPFVLAGPDVPPGVETRPTSHADLAPTLLELLGADPAARATWTLGENLLDPPAERVRVVAGWDTLGLYTKSGILEVPLAAHGGTEIAVYDRRWQRVLDDSSALSCEARALGSLAVECRRFLR